MKYKADIGDSTTLENRRREMDVDSSDSEAGDEFFTEGDEALQNSRREIGLIKFTRF